MMLERMPQLGKWFRQRLQLLGKNNYKSLKLQN